MTDTDRMVVWLRETLDAAQQLAETAAKETTSADWEYQHHDNRLVATSPPRFTVADVDCFDPAPGKFMADNDPAAVLRRIAADRKTLDEHSVHVYEAFGPRCKTCRGGMIQMASGPIEAWQPYPCATIRNLAEGWGWTEETK